MKALILCGGLGTRLRPVINDRPKSLAQVAGRPLLQHQVEYWKRQGVTEFIFAAGYKGAQILNFLPQISSIKVKTVLEEQNLGTGGAILNAVHEAQIEEDFLALNGDTLFEITLDELAPCFIKNESDAVLGLAKVPHIGSRYLKVRCDGAQRILSLQDSQPENPWINGGAYLLRRSWLESWPFAVGSTFSFENQVLKTSLTKGSNIHGVASLAKFIDIGIPEDYAKAQFYFKKDYDENHTSYSHPQ